MQRSNPLARLMLAASLAFSSDAAPTIDMPAQPSGSGDGGRGNRRAPGAHMAAVRAARKARNVRRHRASAR